VAHQRSIIANVVLPTDTRERGRPDYPIALTRAEAHALRRSAPLTPVQSKPLQHPTEEGVGPPRHPERLAGGRRILRLASR